MSLRSRSIAPRCSVAPWLVWAMVGWALNASLTVAADLELQNRASVLRREFTQRLDDLAAWCAAQGLPAEAAATRRWRTPDDGDRLYLIEIAPRIEPAPSDDADNSPRAEWARRAIALRRQNAEALFALCGEARAARQWTPAYRLLLETLRANPDHAAARKLTGDKLVDGQWRSPFEAERLAQQRVWSERFGWLPKAHVARYEKGERFYQNKWLAAADESRARRAANQAWEITTEHFLVRSTHSLEAGVALAGRLEKFAELWRQAFVRYHASDEDLARFFAGQPSVLRGTRRHEVMYLRDREEYQALVRGKVQADLSITTGIYLGDERRSYFFHDEQDDLTTQFHEATHQLFHESRRAARTIGREANFWIIEGIACYMESYAQRDGLTSVGGLDAVRAQDAAFRLLNDNFYVPLGELTAMGMDDFQRDKRIARLYSQSAGLTHFLMHYDRGRYRSELMDYLAAVYLHRDRPATLAELTGRKLGELDAQYREFLQAGAAKQAPGKTSP